MILTTLKSSAKAALERWACLSLSLFALLTSNATAAQSLTQIFALLQVLLARHKESTKYYAVKVLQKKIIMKKKEVSPSDISMNWNLQRSRRINHAAINIPWLIVNFYIFLPAKAHHGWAQCADEEHQASLPGGAALLLPDYWQAVLCSRLCQRWRGKLESGDTPEMEQRPESVQNIVVCLHVDVDRCLSVSSPAVLPSSEREDLLGAQSQVLRCWNSKCAGLPPLPAHCVPVRSDPAVPPGGHLLTWPVLKWSRRATLKLCHFFFFTGTWSLRTSCWTHRATLSSQTLASAKKVWRPMVRHLHSAERLRYKKINKSSNFGVINKEIPARTRLTRVLTLSCCFPHSTWPLRSSRSRPTTAQLTGGVWDRCCMRCSTAL